MIKLKSYAKINLFLDVKRKREDGYHDIETIFQTINLYDWISLEVCSKSKEILIDSDCSQLPLDEGNLAYKAAKLVRDYAGVRKGVQIEIKKRIPIGGGLGGGSSNAATVLLGLNKMWNLNLSLQELFGLAERIGADVPFFLWGGRCLAIGRGEKLAVLPNKPFFWILLICPGFAVSTKEIYEKLNFKLTKIENSNKITDTLNYLDNTYKIGENLFNKLEEKVFVLYPQLKGIKGDLLGEEAILGCLVSGSGSSLFGIVKDRKEGKKIKEKFNKKYAADVYLVKTV